MIKVMSIHSIKRQRLLSGTPVLDLGQGRCLGMLTRVTLGLGTSALARGASSRNYCPGGSLKMTGGHCDVHACSWWAHPRTETWCEAPSWPAGRHHQGRADVADPRWEPWYHHHGTSWQPHWETRASGPCDACCWGARACCWPQLMRGIWGSIPRHTRCSHC